MNSSLSTFMKIAIVALTISAFIFGTLYFTMSGVANQIADFIAHN